MPLDEQVRMLKIRVEYLEGVIGQLLRSDRYLLEKDLEMSDGRNLILALGTGTKIGTSSSQKLGFWGATPVDRPATVSTVTITGTDEDGVARTAINAIIARLQEAGLIA